MTSLVAAKDKVFITQTKLLYEVTWKTVMQIAKKYAKNSVLYLQRLCQGQKAERLFTDWCWWILGGLPFPHLGMRWAIKSLIKYLSCLFSFISSWWLTNCCCCCFYLFLLRHQVRVMDCYFHEGIKVLYRVALAILILFHKHTQNSSEWDSDSLKNDIDNAIPKFCKQIPVTPLKLMRTAFSIRALR